jgi:hypothetical protein
VSYQTSADGPRCGRSGGLKGYRGSQKRLDRIKWHQHTPLNFRIFVLVVVLTLIALATWLLRHPPSHVDPRGPSLQSMPARVTPPSPWEVTFTLP